MALRLDLEFGANDAFRGMDRLIAGMEALEDNVRALTSAFGGAKSGSHGMAADIDRTSRAARSAVGPMERLARAKAQLSSAQSGGDSSAIFDAKVAVVRAQRGVQRGQDLLSNPGADSITTMLGRLVSSGGGGGGRMGGALSGLMGGGGGGAAGALGGAAGPIGLALSLAAAEVTFLAHAAKTAADTINSFAKATITAGGTGAQTASLMRIGAALGIDAPGRARQFGERVWTDGLAKSRASGLGVNTTGGPFGDMNDAQKYLRAVEALTDPSRMSDSEAMRTGRILGLEDELMLRKASSGVRSKALGSMGRSFSEQEQTLAVDNQILMNLAMADFQEVLVELGIQVLPTVTAFLKGVVGIFDDIGNAVRMLNPANWFADKENVEKAASNQHTQAMIEHSKALRDSTDTNLKRTGIPGAWRYEITEAGLRGGAARLGGAGLGGIAP